MFAKNGSAAICIEDYKAAKKGFKIPVANEMYSIVEEWLKTNDWIEVPGNFERQLISIDKAKKEAVRAITEFANECRRKIAGDVDHLESAEWGEKRLRALRIINNEALSGDAEKIETEALYREKNETLDELAGKILDKAERYENASIIITGMTAAAFESVEKTATIEELDALLVSLKDNAGAELAKL
jgi:hypothetical protein